MINKKFKPSIKWDQAPKGATHAVINSSDRGVIITWDKIEDNILYTWMSATTLGLAYDWHRIGPMDIACAERNKTRIKRPGS